MKLKRFLGFALMIKYTSKTVDVWLSSLLPELIIKKNIYFNKYVKNSYLKTY